MCRKYSQVKDKCRKHSNLYTPWIFSNKAVIIGLFSKQLRPWSPYKPIFDGLLDYLMY